MDAKFFEEGQLLDLGEDENDNEGNCKKVTYSVYSCASNSQGYPDILSYDLNKHVSSLSDHMIIESHGLH